MRKSFTLPIIFLALGAMGLIRYFEVYIDWHAIRWLWPLIIGLLGLAGLLIPRFKISIGIALLLLFLAFVAWQSGGGWDLKEI
jgi:hypothetical protein